MTLPADPVIELRDVTKSYPGGVHALRGVDLTVGAGELVAVVGPSGSGKSTMLNVMGTLDRPTTGTVRIAGYDVSELSDSRLSALRARHIGFVFQHFHLAAGRDAVDNVADGLLYAGVPLKERRARARDALAKVRLDHRCSHTPSELSGGEKQRVAIARALVGNPRLLLADEPTGALDTASGEIVMELLRELNASGTTICVITHDSGIADSLPRRVRFKDGEIVADARTGRRAGAPPGVRPGTDPGARPDVRAVPGSGVRPGVRAVPDADLRAVPDSGARAVSRTEEAGS